jgi:hypothetical protein
MDMTYKTAIHSLFERLRSINVRMPEGVERQFLLDDQNGHYQIIDVGWEGLKPVLDVMVYISLKNGFVWVQADNTGHGIVDGLLERGVPQNRIVLGFHAPYKRPYTEFATGNETG